MQEILSTFLFIALSLGSMIPGHDVDDTIIRIKGGEPAPDGAVPYQASLRFGKIEVHGCGGSIIDKRWILTAAHCVDETDPKILKIVVGTNLLDTGGMKYEVERIIVHESYNINNFSNDIALVEVIKDIVFNEKVKPIELPSLDTGAGVMLLLSGWGLASYPIHGTPNELQWLRIKSISVQECQEENNEIYPITERQLCSFNQIGQGTCKGDSGSPLALENEVVGIVSWGFYCGAGNPDVATRVFKYKDWIISNMN